MEGLNRTLETPVNGKKVRCLVKVVIGIIPMKPLMFIIMCMLVSKTATGNGYSDSILVQSEKVQHKGTAKRDIDYKEPDTLVTVDGLQRRRLNSAGGLIHDLGKYILIGTVCLITLIFNDIFRRTYWKKYVQRLNEPDPEDPFLFYRKQKTMADLRVAANGCVASMVIVLVLSIILWLQSSVDFGWMEKIASLLTGVGGVGMPVWLYNKAEKLGIPARMEMAMRIIETMEPSAEKNEMKRLLVEEMLKSMGQKYKPLSNLFSPGKRRKANNKTNINTDPDAN